MKMPYQTVGNGDSGLAATGGERSTSRMSLQHRITLVGLLLIALVQMTGCKTNPPATQPSFVPAGLDDLVRIRASYRQQSPGVEVGMVADVLPAEHLAAIDHVDLTKFHDGDTVCFIDSATAPLVCGKVVRITDTQVHVKYESPTTERRAPVTGDLGVAFK